MLAHPRFAPIVLTAAFLSLAAPLSSTVIAVNVGSDIVALDSRCSLREAINAANTDTAFDTCPAGSGADVIELPLDGGTMISIPGTEEDANATGDFDILEDLTIRGTATVLPVIIDGEQLDRLFHVHPGVTLTLQDVEVTGGLADLGGGIHNEGTLHLVSSTVEQNDASAEGGGIYTRGPVTLTASRVSFNFSDGDGGGIYSEGTDPEDFVVIRGSVLDENFCEGDGGGIWARRLTLDGSALDANTAQDNGGGIFFPPNSLQLNTIVNSTLSGNTAEADGGGLFISGNSQLEIYSSTIAFNAAAFSDPERGGGGGTGIGQGGGVFIADGTAIRMENTILAANVDMSSGPSPELAPDCQGTISSGGFNLFGAVDADDCFIFGSLDDQQGTLASPLDPQLGELEPGTNGLPVRLPSLTSPALDAGDPDGCTFRSAQPRIGRGTPQRLVVDQLGNGRHWDGPDGDTVARCDVGAAERSSRPFLFSDGFESGDVSGWDSVLN